MQPLEFLNLYKDNQNLKQLYNFIDSENFKNIKIKGIKNSYLAVIACLLKNYNKKNHFFIIESKESAAYFYNDLENLSGENHYDYNNKTILFYPTSYIKPYQYETVDNANVLLRAEVLNRLANHFNNTIVVTYPEALSEKVISKKNLINNTFKINKNEKISHDFLIDFLIEYEFERVDFVTEPGEFSVRGSIIDIFSYSGDYPYRIDFFDDEIESIRTFDPSNQRSINQLNQVNIIPNIQNEKYQEIRESILSFMTDDSLIWIDNTDFTCEIIDKNFENALQTFSNSDSLLKLSKPQNLYLSKEVFIKEVDKFKKVLIGNSHQYFETENVIDFNILNQPVFNKNFELLFNDFQKNNDYGYRTFIATENIKQIERLKKIFSEINKEVVTTFSHLNCNINNGYIDHDQKICCYTDHQIFERYHKYTVNKNLESKEFITLKELNELKPGDYVTHTDHGIGRYGGLEKINNNGKEQETIRLVYKENDILYVSIHSLHKISKYSGKEGAVPTLNRLGSPVWQNLKNKTKQKVKDIAKELIKLYAERKAIKGFSFNADTYLQNELEASFIYEDTPDQLKATQDVKKDMESDFPMDRLICGDVGFGKTEIAIRAAFKAVSDNKQVAILVPTTILALQHFKTFTDRLAEFPCKIEYINRFKSSAQTTKIIKELKDGKIDIIIGTHRIVSKDIIFKDLGLLIIDEEQKFGVTVKEKLKKLKINVDTLTLTATPIPRTLQFSLMGARDLSIISTPPPNRFPVHTEIHNFNEEIIRDAVLNEVNRGGQVFFIHNRVQNIMEIAGTLQRLLPDLKIAVGHGQMEGSKLEKIMLDFIEGEYDVLLATTIIESGLDIPNANTIIINEAQTYGLSNLHQLRGRVGRSNKKSFCILLSPPLSVLTDEARKRLKAIEEFSEIGSGFNIAMRDLDIRGAGDILGAEQSGFINDIGFEMYHKILDEAVNELKENEFKDLYQNVNRNHYLKECTIETDLEIMIPDNYVNNITERLSLYKELDNLSTKEELQNYRNSLIDRFGKIPKTTEELIQTITLRKLAQQSGLEKIILKQEKFIIYFLSDSESPFFQSAEFNNYLSYLQRNPRNVSMKENKGRLSITFENVKNVSRALEILKGIVNQNSI